jgi:hypothetical protein
MSRSSIVKRYLGKSLKIFERTEMRFGFTLETIRSIPAGSWLALSQGEEKSIIAHDLDLDEAIRKAKEAGEDNPVMVGRNFFSGSHLYIYHR